MALSRWDAVLLAGGRKRHALAALHGLTRHGLTRRRRAGRRQDRSRLASALRLFRGCLPLLCTAAPPPPSVGGDGDGGGDSEPGAAKAGGGWWVHVGRVTEHVQAMSAVVSYHGQECVVGDRVLACLLPAMLDLLATLPLSRCRC
jgi:hypothetical protein